MCELWVTGGGHQHDRVRLQDQASEVPQLEAPGTDLRGESEAIQVLLLGFGERIVEL